jgi:arylsulfatase A-like enzyme
VRRALRRVLHGAAAGLLGGSMVGILEALFVLSASAQSVEYVALFFAAVLYAALGAALGGAVGALLAPLAAAWRRLDDPVIFSACYTAAASVMGLHISRAVVDAYVYSGRGLTDGGEAAVVGAWLALAAVMLWLGPIFLTRTPFKILLKARGVGALFGAIALLTATFSFAPGRGSPYGTLDPDKPSSLPDDSPGILLIVVDALRADAVGGAGGGESLTHHIDDLAADGVVFESAFASAAWTRASVASLLTSMAPTAHATGRAVSTLPDEVDSLAEVLGGEGYVTGGLVTSLDLARSFNFHQGFDFFRFLAPELPLGATETASQLTLYAEVVAALERWRPPEPRPERYYQPAHVALGHAREFIDARQDGRPWFLFLHLMDPAPPFFDRGREQALTPGDDSEIDALREAYSSEIRSLDGELGRFFEWMKREHHYQDTAIVLVSDHGQEFLEHGGLGNGETLYDEQLHVPLVVKLPRGGRAGQRVQWQVRLIDVAPTLAGLVGLTPPRRWQGRGLFEEGGRKGLVSGDRLVFAEQSWRGNMLAAVRAEGWKIIQAGPENPRGLPPTELFNLAEDPGERHNLAGQAPEKQTELDWMVRQQQDMAASVSVLQGDFQDDIAPPPRGPSSME